MKSSVLTAHVHPPALNRAVLGSVALHLLLALVVWAASFWMKPEVLLLASGTGGGQGGETVRVALTGALDGGSGELFKPSLTPQPPVVPAPEPALQKAAEAEPRKEDFQEASKQPPKTRTEKQARPETTSRTPAAPEVSKPVAEKKTMETAANQIPRETGPGAGGAGPAAGAGGRFGGGQGVRIGSGSGSEGLMNSWYARQVEKRIGENWLRTNFASLAGQRLTTVIRFDILPDGRIDNVSVEQRSGVTFYDLAAERAIRSSNPLPRPPAEFQGRAVRFVSYFEYPPGQGI
ncbi:MAG TPA: cell envelope integrity protein TolA [Acidobacteriota bacterium]|jgi:TonB family protein